MGEIEIRQGDKVLWTGKLVAAEAMMTAEEYAKLSGTQAEASNLLNLDSERRQQLRKYAWLWLLIPACGVAFFLWRGLRGNRQTRHVRSPHPTIHRQRAEAVPTRMPRAARSGMRQPSVRRQAASGAPVRTSQTIARRSKPVQSGAMRPHVRRRSRG